MTKPDLFTVIIDTYYRPALLREAVGAVQRQTHGNLEIILVNNGATPETVEYLHRVAASDNRVKLVHFEQNQFSWGDPQKMVDVCLNAALEAATGEYVWYQGDDDLIADDYAEKMVALFKGNPECTTAAGLPVSIDIDGEVRQLQYLDANKRPKYTSGLKVALDNLLGGGTMLAAPGNIFTVKRLDLIEAGGYHRAVDSSHLYGIVPFGITGFDPTALFYWRHHAGQLNRQLSNYGWIGIDEELSLLKDWRLEERWGVFGIDVARKAFRARNREIDDHAARWFVRNVYGVRLKPTFRIMGKIWLRPYFWYRVLARARQKRYFMVPVWEVLMPPIRAMFRLMPSLVRLSPRMADLHWHVNRSRS